MTAPRDNVLTVVPHGECEIVMTRGFRAPRPLVFDAHTKPELISRWLGVFGGWSMVVCEVDLRVGGAFRYVWNGPDGASMTMRGHFREIVRPERIVSTEAFEESWYPGEAVDSVVLTEQAGRTTVTTTVCYESREARDAVLRSGMEGGMAAGYDALEALLASLAPGSSWVRARPGTNVDSVSRASEAADVASPTRDTVAGRYRIRADAFERKAAAVRPEQWSNPSPCAEWTARDVVGHIVMMHGVMLRPLNRELSPAPSLDDDPLAAFRAARADVEAVLADPALAGTEFDFFGQRITVEDQIDRVVSLDMVIHGWDLARATGQDDTIDPLELAAMASIEGSIPEEVLRAPGVLGPALEPPPGADLQTRVLAYLGRRA